jgi:hypothetical protein
VSSPAISMHWTDKRVCCVCGHENLFNFRGQRLPSRLMTSLYVVVYAPAPGGKRFDRAPTLRICEECLKEALASKGDARGILASRLLGSIADRCKSKLEGM